MNTELRALLLGMAALLSAGCGGDDEEPSEAGGCPALCANEAKLRCPNNDEAGCVRGCQGFMDGVKQMYPACVAEVDARFTCTGQVPLSSMQCNPNSASPIYADGVCASEQAALVACGSRP